MEIYKIKYEAYDIRDKYGARYIAYPILSMAYPEEEKCYELWRVWMNSSEICTVDTMENCKKWIEDNERY